jgi:redox-sensitive bicupin YhaK (pirin superfamily)
MLKPFVFLDLFDYEGAPFNADLHPHSGIATLTYVVEGAVSYIDADNVRGTLRAGGVEWMQAGRGMWHGGGLDKTGRTRGFQLWIALPPELELGPTASIYQAPEDVPEHGPARVLLGKYGSASSPIESPSPINYLAVRLKAGERWRYEPPAGHTVLWVAIASGALSAPNELGLGDLAAFEPSSIGVEFQALTDAEFVLGSAAPHEHDLSSPASTQSTRRPTRFATARRTSPRSSDASFRKAECRHLIGAGQQPWPLDREGKYDKRT